MAIRRLPDGSLLNTDTGALMAGDPAREAAARALAEKQGARRPVISKGQQILPVDVVQGRPIIAPSPSLAISPRSALGAEAAPAAPQNETMKRVLLLGGIVAAAYGVVWLNGKMKGKKA